MARVFARSCSLYLEYMRVKHPAQYQDKKPSDFWVLFVIDEAERNICDQKWIEIETFEKFNIRSLRLTLYQVHKRVRRDSVTGALLIDDKSEVALVYYRTGYQAE